MTELNFNKVFLQEIVSDNLKERNIQLSVLRLDCIHPIISGNKWFKLKYALEDAVIKGYSTIATFGGAHSNHIVAAALNCKILGLSSIGFIRGEIAEKLSFSLEYAMQCGMKLFFVDRESYKNKTKIIEQNQDENWYWINEGGYSEFGVKGISEIIESIPPTTTHIICASGTGTTAAGLLHYSLPYQQIQAINVLKGYPNLSEDIMQLLPNKSFAERLTVSNNYHFGGYAKYPKSLIDFMNKLWELYQLPTDIIYTSKMMFAIFDLIEKGFFPQHSNLVAIHSGGLQGNLSLPSGVLSFDYLYKNLWSDS